MALSTDMLTAFVQVAELGSVSAAAAELGIGKSLASKRIAQLEAVLKATLFSRSTRKIALTPAGETYLDFARRALAEVAQAEERLRELRVDLSGQIRLTAPASWGTRVLARHLPAFMRQHPAIEIELLLADRMMDLAAERVDLALRWTHQTPHDLVSEPVASVGWAVVAAPAYLRGAGTPAEPRDLTQHSCICYWRERSDDRWVLSDGDRRQQLQVRGRYHANSAEAVADAALAGLGVALLPLYVCDEALRDGRLQRVLPDWTPETRYGTRITAVATPERMRLSRNQALLAFLRQQLAG